MAIFERIFRNKAGEEIHEIDGPNGPMLVKKLDTSIWLPTDEQYCPDCHRRMDHKDEGYFECPVCKHSITDEEADDGEGYPTLESTYENDYEEYYGE